MSLKKTILILSLVLFLFFGFLLAAEAVKEYRLRQEAQRPRQSLIEPAQWDDEKDPSAEPAVLEKYKELLELNPHLAGWLRIDNTHVDYPVVKGEDNDYYLTHDFYGGQSVLGTLFIDAAGKDRPDSSNWIIYGHTTSSGTMFGDLKKYKDESFYQENPCITFDTIYEEGTYEIISVFLSRVYMQSDDVFKYYQYVNIDDEETFMEYVTNIKELSLYETGNTASYGDALITLSTCDYYTDQGRLAVVARKVLSQ